MPVTRKVEHRDVPISDLIPYERNPRKNDKAVKKVAASLEQFGLVKNSVVVDEDMVLITGHTTLKAMRSLGWVTCPAVTQVFGLTEEEKRAYRIADNKLGELAEWDLELLAGELASLDEVGFDAELTGFDTDALAEMYPPEKPEVTEDDYEPPVEIETSIQRGDLFRLGRHRLLCGDSTSAEDVGRLMDGKKAIGCVTSPPYAEQRKQQYGGIPADEYWVWFSKIQAAVKSALSDRGNFFLNIKPHVEQKQRHLYVFDLVCSMVREEGWLFVDEYCWLRTGIPQQVVNRFKNAFEPVYWFAKTEDFVFYPEAVRHKSDSVPVALGPGAGNTSAAKRQGKGGGAIQGNAIVEGMAYPSNVLNFKQNAEAIGHPAAYPVQLPSFFIQAYSLPGDVWYEPFLGSGTTIVACEQLGRTCYGMEISPQYCQVIIDRWEKLTGQKAEKVDA